MQSASSPLGLWPKKQKITKELKQRPNYEQVIQMRMQEDLKDQ